MREPPPFRELERVLKRSGVMPDVVERTILELEDHFADLIDEAARAGCDEDAARSYAARALGDFDELAGVVRRRDVLLRWSLRHPLAAACGRSLCSAIALPLVPVIYCAERRESLARWGVSCGLASVFTATLLLALCSMLSL